MSSASKRRIVLASTSVTRQTMLVAAGLPAEAIAPEVDERPVKVKLGRVRPETLAETLAEMKAAEVSRRHADALVIGADQVLECDGKLYDKPSNLDAAKRQLKDLRGKRHRLVTGAAVAIEGKTEWKHVEAATLTMRVFSDPFLDDYLFRAGEDVQSSVGAYRIESLGAQLFSKVEGSHFTILGLPLLALLDYLRRAGAITS